eukprot:gene7488-15326_t
MENTSAFACRGCTGSNALSSIAQIKILIFSLTLVFADFDGKDFKGNLEKVISEKPCVRLFTNHGDLGCRASDSDGTLGALYEIRDDKDFFQTKTFHFNFAVILTGKYFNSSILSALHSTGRLQGVIVIDDGKSWNEAYQGKYSVDSTTPQGLNTAQADVSSDPSYIWNEYGNGLMYNSYDFPIVMADSTEISKLKKYAAENRVTGYMDTARVNVAQFTYYMGAKDITSKKCLEWTNLYGNRDPKCLPVGGQSVWGTAGSLDQRDKVVVTVGIDSTAAFHDLALGANDAVASIVALLSAADAISRSAHDTLTYQPLFFLANAEEWGYAGSRRFVRDLISFQCDNPVGGNETVSGMPLCAAPVYPNTMFQNILGGAGGTKIRSVLALDQIGAANGNFYVQALARDANSIGGTVKKAAGSVQGVTVTVSNTGVLPPSPLTSFVMSYGELDSSFSGAVLTGYGNTFNNPHYHTRLDNSSAEGGVPAINETWTKTLLSCLLTDWDCDFMRRYTTSEMKIVTDTAAGNPVDFGTGLTPPSYYTGVLTAYGSGGGQPVVSRQGYLYS